MLLKIGEMMFAKSKAILDAILIDEWRAALKLWSIRVAIFWGAVWGVILVWPALAGVVPLWIYAIVGIVASASYAAARMLRQPGTD